MILEFEFLRRRSYSSWALNITEFVRAYRLWYIGLATILIIITSAYEGSQKITPIWLLHDGLEGSSPEHGKLWKTGPAALVLSASWQILSDNNSKAVGQIIEPFSPMLKAWWTRDVSRCTLRWCRFHFSFIGICYEKRGLMHDDDGGACMKPPL